MAKFLYADSSLLVSIACNDARGKMGLDLLKTYDRCFTSIISEIECQAGITTQAADNLDSLIALENNLENVFDRINLITINRTIVNISKNLLRRYRLSLGLRSLDSIHVATAKQIQTTVGTQNKLEYTTADRRQGECFTREGLRGKLFT